MRHPSGRQGVDPATPGAVRHRERGEGLARPGRCRRTGWATDPRPRSAAPSTTRDRCRPSRSAPISRRWRTPGWRPPMRTYAEPVRNERRACVASSTPTWCRGSRPGRRPSPTSPISWPTSGCSTWSAASTHQRPPLRAEWDPRNQDSPSARVGRSVSPRRLACADSACRRCGAVGGTANSPVPTATLRVISGCLPER